MGKEQKSVKEINKELQLIITGKIKNIKDNPNHYQDKALTHSVATLLTPSKPFIYVLQEKLNQLQVNPNYYHMGYAVQKEPCEYLP